MVRARSDKVHMLIRTARQLWGAAPKSRVTLATWPRSMRRGRAELSTTVDDSSADDTKRRILEAASKHVGVHGWSNEALANGAKDVGLSTAAHGQFGRGPVDLVEYVAAACLRDLVTQIDERADELAQLKGWRPRLELAIEMRLKLSLPWHQHRAQALGLMLSPGSSAGLMSSEPAAIRALAAVADELARATLVDSEDLSQGRWRARRAAAAGAYALVEARAISDTSHDLQDTLAFSKRVVDMLGAFRCAEESDVLWSPGDAAEAPEALRDALRAGTLVATSLGGAALAFFPPKAVGALPQLLDVAASRATSTLSSLVESTLVSHVRTAMEDCVVAGTFAPCASTQSRAATSGETEAILTFADIRDRGAAVCDQWCP